MCSAVPDGSTVPLCSGAWAEDEEENSFLVPAVENWSSYDVVVARPARFQTLPTCASWGAT